MSEVTVKNSEALTILKCLRDLLLGAIYLKHTYRVYKERLAMQVVMAKNIAEYVFVLDLYLTDKTEQRDLEKEQANALELLLGKSWEVLLSDGESKLLLRLPTKGNMHSVRAVFPDMPKNATAYHRWPNIDTPESQPTEFGPPDDEGYEMLA